MTHPKTSPDSPASSLPKLKAALPQFLMARMNLTHDQAVEAAEGLADELIRLARQCPNDTSIKSLSSNGASQAAPSREECAAFEEMLLEIVHIRRSGTQNRIRRTPFLVKASGRLWALIHQVLGTTDKEWQREQETPNAVIGTRA